jgi:hypothetical protein
MPGINKKSTRKIFAKINTSKKETGRQTKYGYSLLTLDSCSVVTEVN